MRITTVAKPPNEDADREDFVLSVRELPGKGTGAGADWFAAHRHGPPCEPGPPLQQQQRQVPLPLQQHRCCAEDTAARRGESLPRLQAIPGRVSAGTSMAASHTKTFAVMLLHSRITSAWYLAASRLPQV
jgi:hypothetical protein